MRLAIIDLGTNSVRFDVHEISENRKGQIFHRRLYREKAMVRLGQNLFLKEKLSPESIRRTLDAVASFRETMDVLRVTETLAFGTAAMRDASNGPQFLEDIKRRTGIEFRIIGGAEEASLISKGILANESTPKGIYALVDIGGGSTEISICKDKAVLHSHSFPLGVAKLQEVFLKTQPPARESKKNKNPITELRNFVKSKVLPVQLIEHWPKAPKIIGSSGSILAISKIVNGNENTNLPFERKDLSKVVSEMKTMTADELLSLEGMDPKRVDLILAGGLLLNEICELLGAKEIRTTEFALRDGILINALGRYRKHKSKTSGFSLDEIEKRTQAWGIEASRYKPIQQKAEWLFERLAKIHRLKPEWKKYLSSAAILHDVGDLISHAHYSEHSEYIVKNANFMGMQPWESNLIGVLCRFHREEKVLDKKHEKKIPFEKKDPFRTVFLKLLSLLQMADSLDRGRKNILKLKSLKISKNKIELKFSSKTACDLEMLRFEQKRILFQQIFRKEITLKKV